MGDRAAVESQALLRLLEVAADHVDERLQRRIHSGFESIEVVHGDHTRLHVPLVLARLFVRRLDVRLGPLAFPEDLYLAFRIRVSPRGIREEAPRLGMT